MHRMTCSFLPILLFAACHGDGSAGVGPDPAGASVHAVAGAGVTDTVDAQLTQALIVEVRDSVGHAAPGVVVRFETQQASNPAQGSGSAGARVCALTVAYCSNYFASDTTDAQGRANILVRMGTTPGNAEVRLSVPELGLLDSVSYTVTPGAPAHVRAAATDTAVDLGVAATLPSHVTDRYFNPRPEVPTLSLGTGSVLTLDAAKSAVTGTVIGTQWLYTKYDKFVDSTSVRVVPPGRLAVWSAPAREVRLVNTNGSSVLTLARSVSSDFGAFPHFDPSRQHVTLHAGTASYGGPSTNIVIVDTASLARQDLGTTLGFTTIITERQQVDGSLLVVGQRTSVAGYSLWRVTLDGTVSAVVGLPSFVSFYDAADISRDGTRVVYVASATAGGTELRVLDVTSGSYTVLATGVLSPRFSPQADRVAFLVPSGQYSSADGIASVIDISGANRKSFGSFVFSPGLGWSPDGTYLLGRNSGPTDGAGLRVLRVSDGANVMLRFRGTNTVEDYYQPDWR